jgi:hypothetical protein
MPDYRSSEGYQTHFAQRRQIEEEQAREVRYFHEHQDKAFGPETCNRTGHVEGCPGSAGGDHELLPGWISYEENGVIIDVETTWFDPND